MLVVHDRIGGRPLSRQAFVEPHQRGRDLGILVPEPLDELDGEGCRQGTLFVVLEGRGDRRGGGRVHAEEPVGQRVRFLALGAARHDALRPAPEILHEHDPQRDRDRPQLADRQRLNPLVRAHEPAQHLGVETAVGMRDEGPGDAEDPRIAGEGSGSELRELPVVGRGQIIADLADLLLDEVIVVEQPFGGRRDRAALADCVRDRAIGVEQGRFVLLQAGGERPPARRLRGDDLGHRETLRMLLEPLDAEELLADGLFAVPRRSLRRSPERATEHRSQSGPPAASVRGKSGTDGDARAAMR